MTRHRFNVKRCFFAFPWGKVPNDSEADEGKPAPKALKTDSSYSVACVDPSTRYRLLRTTGFPVR